MDTSLNHDIIDEPASSGLDLRCAIGLGFGYLKDLLQLIVFVDL